ncbi:MAG: WbqC family protein [Bacteroidales bacterium]|nr:WbqC family protein [Bacteroidales bacterium]
MTLAGNQPYFLPYFPYWQLIAAADTFLVSDDYAYIKAGWVNRNRILVNGRPQYFRLEVQHSVDSRLIMDKRIVPIDVITKLQTIEMAYHAAPFFAQGYGLMERIFSYQGDKLIDILELSIKEICAYLGITTKFIRTSSLEGNSLFRREYRVYDFCSRLGADRFINAIGGQALYSKEEFKARGVTLNFIHSTMPPYDQSLHYSRYSTKNAFVPGLSVLDAIMFNSREALHDMLGMYELI